MTPMQAAFKGASEIASTILSISTSLVAVFIPLLLMGGIVGRLFREFALTVTMTIGVSLVVALTLTPVMCSRWLKRPEEEKHGKLYRWIEAGFEHMACVLCARPATSCSRTRSLTLMSVFADGRAERHALCRDSKGLLPASRTRDRSSALRRRRRTFRSTPCASARRRLPPSSPRIRTSLISPMRSARPSGSRSENVGRFWIGLKPRDATHRRRRKRSSTGCGRSSLKVEGVTLVLAGAAGFPRRRPSVAHRISIYAAGRQSRRAQRMGAAHVREAEGAAACCRTSPATSRPMRPSSRSPSIATRRRASASSRSSSTTRSMTPSASGRSTQYYHAAQQQYHVILEIDPVIAGRSGDPRQDLCQVAHHRRHGAALDLREIRHDAYDAICRSTIRANFRR